MIHKQRNIKNQAGVAAIEFAFLVIPLFTIMIIAFEASALLIEDNNLNKSTRDSARYLADHWGVEGSCNMTQNLHILFLYLSLGQ